MENNITTDDVRKCLRWHYGKAGFVLYEEVKRSSGFTKPERFCDALAISLFPSAGIFITGFEIKASRSDLLNELRDREKSEAFKQFCDYWILVVTDKEILKGKENIPDDWGIWACCKTENGQVFAIIRKPKQLYPKPLDRYFMASLLGQKNTASRDR